MSRSWLLSLLCLSLALFVLVFVQLSKANSRLRVNEPATRFLIQEQTIVALEVVNPAGQPVAAQLSLELLDPEDLTRGVASRQVTLQPGLNKLAVPLTLNGRSLNEDDDKELPWYRVRYRIAPLTANGPDGSGGLISLSEIDTPDIFALQVSAPLHTSRGARHYTHVRAFHPITAKPVPDVAVSVVLKVDDDEPGTTIKGTGVTDAAGYALVSLNIPNKLTDDEGELKVVACHGAYVRETSSDIEVSDHAHVTTPYRLAKEIVGPHLDVGVLLRQIVGAIRLYSNGKVWQIVTADFHALIALRIAVVFIVQFNRNGVIAQTRVVGNGPVGIGNAKTRGLQVRLKNVGVFRIGNCQDCRGIRGGVVRGIEYQRAHM